MDKYMEERIDEVMKLNTNHQYEEALELLRTVTEQNGKWYYASGYANSCLGNNILACEMLEKAVSLEPDNMEYSRLLSHLKRVTNQYKNSEYGSGMKTAGKDKDGDGCLASLCLCCWPGDIDV